MNVVVKKENGGQVMIPLDKMNTRHFRYNYFDNNLSFRSSTAHRVSVRGEKGEYSVSCAEYERINKLMTETK